MAKKNTLSWVIGIIVIIAIIIGWKFYSNSGQEPDTIEEVEPVPTFPESVVEPEVTQPAEAIDEPSVAIETQAPIIPAPKSLDNSDPQVHSAVTDFAPKLSKWLLPNEQVRKWVLTIDLLADGKMPKRYLPIDYPMSKFSTDEQSALASSNYARMDEVIDSVTRINSSLAARYYKEWLPVLEQAYKEQGKAGSFDQRFKQTISQVLATEPLEQAPTLKRPGVLYRYADQNLEEASDIEKLMWRMGPENSEKVQNFLRDLRNQIDKNKEN